MKNYSRPTYQWAEILIKVGLISFFESKYPEILTISLISPIFLLFHFMFAIDDQCSIILKQSSALEWTFTKLHIEFEKDLT